MADREISIGIKATGGDQAAAEIKKPAEAAEETAAKSTEALEKSNEAYEQWLADHKRRQEQYAAAAEQAADRVAEAQEKATKPATPAADASRGFGGMLETSPPGRDEGTDAIERQTQAIERQTQALEDLTDAEAGVARSTGRLNDEAKKPDGFAMLFSQQRLIEIGRQLGQLATVAGEFGREWAKTEEGQRALAGLSDETKAFGSVALGVASSVAQGFATGGPIGAALGGITALVEKVGGAWVESNERIKASNAEVAQAEEEHYQRMEQRRRAAANDAIERRLRREEEALKDQSAELRTQNELWEARKAAEDATLNRRNAEGALRGEDPFVARRREIDLEEKQAMGDLLRERNRVDGEVAEAQRRRDEAAKAANDFAKANGTTGPEYAGLRDKFDVAEAERLRLEQERPGRLEAIARRERSVRDQAAADRDQLEEDRLDRDLQQRRAQQRDVISAGEAQQRRQQQEEARIEALGREGSSAASQAAGAVARTNQRAARRLDELGARFAANPTDTGAAELEAAANRLADTLERQGDASGGRSLRELARRLDRVEAKLKTTRDGK
jgi:hypothetical protein